MVKTTLTHDRSQAGFTLVELAIVMIIIGLLIGGILKGQELIANAQVTATASQIKAVEAALNTFDDSYSAMPGDMLNPGTRLPGCAGLCNANGTGNGRVDDLPSIAGAAGEAQRFWIQMATADLLGGINPGTTAATAVAWGEAYPAADIGGGFAFGYAPGTPAGADANAPTSGHYLSLRQTPNAVVTNTADNANLKPTQAARIDRKIDDGVPNAGTTRAAGPATCMTGGAAGTYVESTATADCQLYIRIKG